MKNYLGQAAALADAGLSIIHFILIMQGNIFFLNELENKDLSLMGFEEDALEATNCYLSAIKVSKNIFYTLMSKIYMNNKKPVMAASLFVEMASILKVLILLVSN